MSVIVITDVCSASCDYCFYSTILAKKKKELLEKGLIDKKEIFYDFEKIKKLGNKIKDAQLNISLGNKTVAISGGEPTLHPQFIEICKYFFNKGLNIHLLSNFSFKPDGEIAKFIKKNIGKFKFLVNFNEPEKQPTANNTIKNLINIDDDKIKIGLNIYHPNFNFEHLIYVLKNTKNIKILRIGLPNPQVNEGINKGVLEEMEKIGFGTQEELLKEFKQDLFEKDLQYIKDNNKGYPYGLNTGKIKEYYNLLSKEIDKLINLIIENGFEDRILFYIDCGFDYKVLSDFALGFMTKRLFFKNPCSIPNGDIQITNGTSQCYTLLNWGNFDKNINIDDYSLREISKFYIISTVFLTNGFLKTDLNFDMCSAYHVRYFIQLFCEPKNGEFIIGGQNEIINDYKLKNLDFIINNYLELYKNGKDFAVIRLFQLIEFLISRLEFEKGKYVLDKIQFLSKNYYYYIWYYKIILEFASLIKETKYEEMDVIRQKFIDELNLLRESYNNKKGDIPDKKIENLDKITEKIINNWIYLK